MVVNDIIVNKNVKNYYWLLFLEDFFKQIFFGIGAFFYLEKVGLELYQITLLKIFSPLVIVLLEIPTGMLSDRVSRKLSYLLSCFSCSIGFLIYYYSATFFQCVIAEIFYSISIAFGTGSMDALLISQIKRSGNPNFIKSFIIKYDVIKVVAIMFGGATGIIIGWHNLSIPWLIGSIGMPITGLLAVLVIKSDFFESIKNEKKRGLFFNLRELKDDFINYFLKNRVIAGLVLISISMSFINAPLFNFWNIFLNTNFSVERKSIAYLLIFVTYNFLIALGNLTLTWIKEIKNSKALLILAASLIIFPTFVMILTGNKLLAISCFLLSEYARGLYMPNLLSLYNSLIPDNKRSIFLSKLSLMMRVSSVLSLLLSGKLTRLYKSVALTLTVSSLISLIAFVFSIYYLFIDENRKIKVG